MSGPLETPVFQRLLFALPGESETPLARTPLRAVRFDIQLLADGRALHQGRVGLLPQKFRPWGGGTTDEGTGTRIGSQAAGLSRY